MECKQKLCSVDIECGNGICVDTICNCITGNVNVNNYCSETCSADIDCGDGVCVDKICNCTAGYENMYNYCAATCASDPCQVWDLK